MNATPNSAQTPSPAEVKAAYVRRADAVTYTIVYGNDWTRLHATADLLRHHGFAATWPVVWDGIRRAVGAGPHIRWYQPPSRTTGDHTNSDEL